MGTGCPPETDTAITRQPSSKSSEKYTRTPSVTIDPSHFTRPVAGQLYRAGDFRSWRLNPGHPPQGQRHDRAHGATHLRAAGGLKQGGADFPVATSYPH